ncbi:MAG: hypothetical protein AUG51_24750 [Acidobacteria bacterium 13_1_20CM_3_53_8]|nr:MAG: hypothetical protein AUG51_24750 [Acidobacteria bacterium 13_1_20CM_3_53_8]
MARLIIAQMKSNDEEKTRGHGRRRQKVKGKRQKLGEANLFIKSGFSLPFAFYLLPFYFLLLRLDARAQC